METPVCDFARAYAEAGGVRMHMPGHKGKPAMGPEALDLTEITGADELYPARGILRRSEENAAALFGTARTLYSAEGSSLCIRGMLALAAIRARETGRPFRVLAGRNAHRTLLTAAALLDAEIDWIDPEPEEGLLRCGVTPEKLERLLAEQEVKSGTETGTLAHMPAGQIPDAGGTPGREARTPAKAPYTAVYLTTPDYLGNCLDLRPLAEVCHRRGMLLLVDNAHGAYLRFLPEDRHPITQGADLCCDSAHKTFPCLTGAAYLHISRQAPGHLADRAEAALAMFASTSPSWLILQSLDRMNAALAGDWPARLAKTVARTAEEKERLRGAGWELAGNEPMKITLQPKSRGYTGLELHALLREAGIEAEFADPDFLTLMPSPDTAEGDWRRLRTALAGIPARPARTDRPPAVGKRQRVCSLREALLSPWEEIPVSRAAGRILADAMVSCPPAVPIALPGERLDDRAISCFRYYGTDSCRVLTES